MSIKARKGETQGHRPSSRRHRHPKSLIRTLGESLDAHRKRQQALHPGLTITDMYNVLEKLGKNQGLTAKDRVIHEQGLVSVLRQIHDDLDSAVADAYGWSLRQAQGGAADLPDEEILRRRRRSTPSGRRKEAGHHPLAPPRVPKPHRRIRRPRHARPGGEDRREAEESGEAAVAEIVGRAGASRSHGVVGSKQSITAAELSRQFKGAKADRIGELLATLAVLGQARPVAGERFVA